MTVRPHRLPLTPVLLVAGFVVAAVLIEGLGIRWNRTSSAPVGLYQLQTADYSVGDHVAVCLPATVAGPAVARGYLTRGSCPGDSSAVVKVVGAASGDLVQTTHRGVLINGRLAQFPPPSTDSTGRPLEPIPTHRRLAGDELWLLSHHANSWDSRFYGPVQREWVQGRVRPLWVFKVETSVASP